MPQGKKHYNVRVIVTEVDFNEVQVIGDTYRKTSTPKEFERSHRDTVQVAITEDTEANAVKAAISILNLRLESSENSRTT